MCSSDIFRTNNTKPTLSTNKEQDNNNKDDIIIKIKPSNLYNKNIKNTSITKFPIIAKNEIMKETPRIMKNIEIEKNIESNIGSGGSFENKLKITELTKKLNYLELENDDLNKVNFEVIIYRNVKKKRELISIKSMKFLQWKIVYE